MRDVDLHGGCRLALVRLETSWIKRGWSGTRCLGHCPVGRGAVHLRQAAEVRGVRPAHRWEDGRRQGQRHEDEGLSELRPQHPGEGLARRRPPHRPLAPASAPRHGFTDTGNTKKQRGLFVFFVAPPPHPSTGLIGVHSRKDPRADTANAAHAPHARGRMGLVFGYSAWRRNNHRHDIETRALRHRRRPTGLARSSCSGFSPGSELPRSCAWNGAM